MTVRKFNLHSRGKIHGGGGTVVIGDLYVSLIYIAEVKSIAVVVRKFNLHSGSKIHSSDGRNLSKIISRQST